MLFCKNCNKYLTYKEINDKLYKVCSNCEDYKEDIQNFCVYTKKYKNIEEEHLELNNKVKNINILNDPTIPTSKSKCKKCKKINKNPFIVKYINNHFKTIYTCKKCLMNYF